MKINGTTLVKTIRLVQQYGGGAEHVNILVKSGKMQLSAQNEGKVYATILPVEGEDSWKCAVSPQDTFTKLLTGPVTVEYDDKLLIKSSSFRGEFSVSEYSRIEMPEFTESPIEQAHIEQLRQGVLLTSINEILSKPSVEFQFTGKRFLLATWDRVHFSTFSCKSDAFEMSSKLMYEDALLMLTAVPSANSFSMKNGFMTIKNATTKFATPALQVEGEEGLREIMTFVEGFHSPLCEVSPKDLILAVDRATSACERGQSIKIKFNQEKEHLSITVVSQKSKFTELVGASGIKENAEINVDPGAFMDILALAKSDTVYLGVHNSLVWLSEQVHEGKHYMAALTTQDAL